MPNFKTEQFIIQIQFFVKLQYFILFFFSAIIADCYLESVLSDYYPQKINVAYFLCLIKLSANKNMLLSGDLYKTTSQGWKNTGNQTLEFNDPLVRIPIYSRCNIFLKNENQDKGQEEKGKEQIKQVHCLSLSLPSQKTRVINDETKKITFSSKVQFLKKSIRNQSSPDIKLRLNRQIDDTRVNQTENKSEPIGKQQQERPSSPSSIDQKQKQIQQYKQREIHILHELENEKSLRKGFERDYNNLLKQALKKQYNIEDDNRKFSGSEEGEAQTTPHTLRNCTRNTLPENCQEYQMKSEESFGETKGKNQINQFKKTSFIDDIVTERTKTKPRIVEESQDDENQSQIRLQLAQTHRPGYRKARHPDYEKRMFEEKIINQMEQISNRIDRVQGQIQIREEKMKHQFLERQLQNKQLEIKRLMNEKLLLKQSTAVSSRESKPIFSQKSQLSYLIVFLLGLVLAKVLLC